MKKRERDENFQTSFNNFTQQDLG